MKFSSRLFKVVFVVILTTIANGCARYGLPLVELPEQGRLTQKINLSALNLGNKLEVYLKQKSLFKNRIEDRPSNQIFFESPWIADKSLQYYYLHWDIRARHQVQWKIVWRVKELSQTQAELSAEVFEVLFWGPSEDAPLNHEAISGNWVSTPQDGLRLSQQFTKFLKNLESLSPKVIVDARPRQIEIPEIQFRPKGEKIKTFKDPVIFSGPFFF